MTDRELLELAAKAAGLTMLDTLPNMPFWANAHEGLMGPWNPLEDDGDALRLAADLRLQILPGKHVGDGCSVNPTHHTTAGVTVFLDSNCMREQIRLTVVMCAAEIGRSMP